MVWRLPAQKLFTSIAAFELLGTAYRFKTEIAGDGEIKTVCSMEIFI
jgi:D-alanyl-D-alanine carboxypeptidase